MVKIKCCGMTNLDDCKKAADLSIDFIGFVFYEASRRYVTPAKVKEIVTKLGNAVSAVGIFVTGSDREIQEIVDYCRLDYAQIYRESGLPKSITAYRIADSLPNRIRDGLVLFDSYSEDFGGSGKSFDFTMLGGCDVLDHAFVAGGLNEENISEVLRLKPFGVDLVSALEERKGKKDHRKMEAFVNKVRSLEP